MNASDLPSSSKLPRRGRSLRLTGLAAVGIAAIFAILEPRLPRAHAAHPAPAVGDLVRLKARTGEGVFRIVGHGLAQGETPVDWMIRSVQDESDAQIVSGRDIEPAR